MRTARFLPAALALPAVVVVVAAPQALAQKPQPKRTAVPAGFVADYDIKYVPNGDPAQELDIYFPENRAEKPQPLLVWIHGGGWSAGSKTQVPYLYQLPRGYLV